MDTSTTTTHGLVLQVISTGDREEWRSVSNARERRRVQNRINQRSRRSRQREQRGRSSEEFDTTIASSRSAGSSRSLQALINAVLAREVDLKALMNVINILDPQSQDNSIAIGVFEAIAHQSRVAGVPRPMMLSSLVQFNITRSLIANAEVLGLTLNQLHDDAISPFVVAGPWPSSVRITNDTLPVGLIPTALQRTVEHHPWIDLLPVARLRDNILHRNVDSFDEDELCCAFTGRYHASGPGVIVWGAPWDSSGWEVTEEFARSWPWVIESCSDIFQSTNMWRARRGERPLFRPLPATAQDQNQSLQ
ncbi:hypothetical protein F5Y09DRAFT_324430 [Xylaria sp. FL1042]|nr:hypothetical protein F5Y09DRAFT_324430 [Xylaria sp. FL1042]